MSASPSMPLLDAAVFVGALVGIAACSALGISISSSNAANGLQSEVLTGLSAGVLVSVAWLHLLDDAQEKLDGLTEYPAANAAMLAGYLLMACVNSGTMCHHHSNAVPLLPTSSPKGNEHGASGLSQRFHVLEASISLHSILIGLGIGLATTGWRQQVVLALALCVHQFLEGLALGMLGRTSKLSRLDWQRTFLAFTLSLPIGAAAGALVRCVYTDFAGNRAVRWCSGLLNAFAAGTLTNIGVGMVSTLAEGSDTPRTPETVMPFELKGTEPLGALKPPLLLGQPVEAKGLGRLVATCRSLQPMVKMIAACLGAAVMAFLAIWA